MEYEYIFGETSQSGELRENVKTIGSEPSDLKGFVTVKREYPDYIIVDKFRVTSHYEHKIGEDGKYYDWYEIDDHIRYLDNTSKEKEDSLKLKAIVEYIAMMTDVDIPLTLTQEEN